MTKESIKRRGLVGGSGLIFVFLLAGWTTPGVSMHAPPAGGRGNQAQQDKPAEQAFKNIQVLKGMPSSQLRPTMAFIAASLGVRCDYCHTNPWDSDAKPTKKIAREMILMMRRINEENSQGALGSRVTVNCATCHNGHAVPASVPPFGRPASRKEGAGAAQTKAPDSLPSVDQVFDNYVKALGGKAALDKLTTRIIKASETSADGTTATVEVYAKAPNQMLSVTTADPPAKATYAQGFPGDGTAWGQFNNGRVAKLTGLDLSQATRDAEFHKGLGRFKEEYSHVAVKGREVKGGREVYVVEGMNTDDFREKLFFDVNTGLLVGRYGEMKTALGPLPFQVEYDDYREVDGVKLPFTTRWSLPDNGWTDKIKEVKHNVPIEPGKFTMPPPPPPKKDG